MTRTWSGKFDVTQSWAGTFDITQAWTGTVGVFQVSTQGSPIGLLLTLTYAS